MTIGGLTFPAGGGLAPMAGVSDMPFRLLCYQQGAAWAVTEMLSAKGYLYAPQSRQTLALLARQPDREGLLGLQLFGHEPQIMAEAAGRLYSGFDFIDLNMGCPAPKIVSGGDGAALMRQPALAGAVIQAVVRRVPCPVTVKLRAGWDEDHKNALLLCRVAQEAGAAAVTLHPRTRTQFYGGAADWSLIGEAAAALSIPVIGNGDVTSAQRALDMMRETGCAGVMVGRAARGNPWIFRQIACALKGAPCPPPSFAQRVETALRHLDMEVALRGERSAVLEMRSHAAWYLSGYPGCARARAHLNTLEGAREVAAALRALLDERPEQGPSFQTEESTRKA